MVMATLGNADPAFEPTRNGREPATVNGNNLSWHRPQITEASRNVDGVIHDGKLSPKPPYRFIGELPGALAHLRHIPQWVAWDYCPKDGKWTKPPFNPRTGRHASVSDRATWGTFDAALAGMEKYGFVGVGVALDENIAIVGIDLDRCIMDAGSFSDLAAEIIGYGETYAEISPSGAGIRLFARGKIDRALKDDASGVEVYGSGRYLTVTGQHIPETPACAAEAPRTLARLNAVVAAAREAKKQRRNSEGDAPRSSSVGDFFRRVNEAALANLGDWVPGLFPKAAKQATGAWRITSKDLGRSHEEDLSLHPSGIQDFGPETSKTPIDLVLDHGDVADTVEAALWLCHRCGINPTAIGFRQRNTEHKTQGNGSDTANDDLPGDLRAWPIMESKATYGLVGKIAHLATAKSEADPVAVIATTLAYAAAEFGRAQYIRIGDDLHHSRHFDAIVGQSSRARKGTSYGPVRRIFEMAETIRVAASTLPFPSGSKLKISSGPLSSGEGLVYAVRDGGDEEPGVKDKRLLVVEQELGAALRAFQRTGNNLSMILRMAFDGGTIAPLTKHNRTEATNPHINVVGHITKFELKELLAATEIWNGLGNRFQWLVARRPKIVAFPEPMPDEKVRETAEELARVIALAHARDGGGGHELVMSNSAQDHWVTVYPELTQDYPGILGAVTSRQEAHARRLALTYAQLDGAERIEIAHLEAALSFCRYAFDSAAYLFGGAELDPVAQTILKALSSGPKSQTEVRDLFKRHQPAEKLTQVLTDLQERGRITLSEEPTKGRPRKVWSLES
jgi:hypothetical protein